MLTKEHKASSADEIQRIKNAGGTVKGGRIVVGDFELAVSRAFGDFQLKPYVVVDPYTSTTELTAEDSYLIVACDGKKGIFFFNFNFETEITNLSKQSTRFVGRDITERGHSHCSSKCHQNLH